jgi:hypothetical protein
MGISNETISILDSSGNTIIVAAAAAVSASGLMVMGSDGTDARFLAINTSGQLVVVGAGVAGSASGGVITVQGSASGTPIPISGSISATNPSVSTTGAAIPTSATLVGGSDGTDLRALSSDTSGRLVTVGAGTAGSPVGGVFTIQGVSGGQAVPISGSISATNPSVGTTGAAIPTSSTLVGGSDGTDLRALSTDSSGRLVVIGNVTPANAFTNPTTAFSAYSLVGAYNGSTWDEILSRFTNADGEASVSTGAIECCSHSKLYNGTTWDRARGNAAGGQWVQGPSASGSATAGNPLLVGGINGSNVYSAAADTSGRFIVVGAGTAGSPVGGVFTIQGVSGGQAVPITGSISATNPSVGTTGAAIPTSSTLIGGSDGVDLRALSVDTSGRLVSVGAGAAGSTLVGNPVQIGGSDGTNTRTLATNTSGNLIVAALTDSAPSTSTITVKDAASTSTTVANGQVFVTGTPTTSSFVSFSISTLNSCIVQVTGTWTGTVVVETSVDSGTTWVARSVFQDTLGAATSFTLNFQGTVNTVGCTNIRVRATATWTGTATVKVIETVNEPTSDYAVITGAGLGATYPAQATVQNINTNVNSLSVITYAGDTPQYEDNTNNVAWTAQAALPTLTNAYIVTYGVVGASGLGYVKSAAGKLYELWLSNNDTSTHYFVLTDTAGAPSSAPTFASGGARTPIPVAAGAIAGPFTFPMGSQFANGIGYADCTTMAGGTANTNSKLAYAIGWI